MLNFAGVRISKEEYLKSKQKVEEKPKVFGALHNFCSIVLSFLDVAFSMLLMCNWMHIIYVKKV